MSNNTTQKDYKYIAVLDLGSESMYAFIGSNEGYDNIQDIELQNKDNIFKWTGRNISDIEVFKDTNGKISSRLLNKIALNTDKGELIGDDAKKELHAKLDFNKDNNYINGKSIFNFFQENANYNFQYLCNPKVIYSKGVKDLLPEIKSGNSIIEVESDLYLKHLMAQVVNNLIRYSPQTKDILPEEIKLVVTIPNVYSPTHAKELVDFLKANTEHKHISYIYESETIIYASLFADYKQFDSERNSVYDELQFITESIFKEEKFGKKYIISHDIGKGTTDLSLFSISSLEENKHHRNITNMSRIGVTKGGNVLDYIFVEYFNEILLQYYKENDLEDEEHFSFTKKIIIERREGEQNKINNLLQKIIFLIKSNISEKYNLPKGIYYQIQKYEIEADDESIGVLLNKKIKEVCNLIHKLNLGFETKKYNEKFEDEKVDIKDLEVSLYDKFISSIFRKKIFFKPTLAKSLKKSIETYVNELSEVLPDILKHNTIIRDPNTKNGDIGNTPENTFLIISGQASQFKPLLVKLKYKYNKTFKLKKTNILALKGEMLKKICAIGGYTKERNRNYTIINKDELLADYFFKYTVKGFPDSFIDYAKLNSGDMIKENNIKGNVNLFYSTILRKELLSRKLSTLIQKEDYESFIRQFNNKTGITIQYDKVNKHFIVDEEIIKLGSNIDTDYNIYKNIWPEILKK